MNNRKMLGPAATSYYQPACCSDQVIPAWESAIAALFESERIVLDAGKGGSVDFAGFQAAWAAFERSRI